MKEINSKKQFTFVFWVSLIIAAGLAIGGFFCPPRGVIDGSVLTVIGLIFLWPALGFGIRAIEEGAQARIEHKNTVITISGDGEETTK